jgi:hypothetical protein
MITGSNRSRRMALRLACVGAVGTAVLVAAPLRALAAGDLSSVILSETIPGLVVAPPGNENGPITQTNISAVLGGASSPAVTELGDQLKSGDVSGYIRAWRHEPPNGDAVVINAFAFSNPGDGQSFLGGVVGGLQQQAGVTPFAVPGVAGATGYTIHSSTQGTPITEYLIAFEKGNTYYQISVVSESGDLSSNDAVRVATDQAANAPGTSTPMNWTPVVVLSLFAGGIVLSVGIVLLARRRAYPPVFGAPPPMAAPGHWAPPTPSGLQP